MGNIKRKHSTAFKVKIAMELIRETETLTAICSKHSIHPTQARRWKQQALNLLQDGLGSKKNSAGVELKEKERLIEELYKQIGQLKVELDWLKKKSNAF